MTFLRLAPIAFSIWAGDFRVKHSSVDSPVAAAIFGRLVLGSVIPAAVTYPLDQGPVLELVTALRQLMGVCPAAPDPRLERLDRFEVLLDDLGQVVGDLGVNRRCAEIVEV